MPFTRPKIEFYPEHLREVILERRDDTNVKMTLGSLGTTFGSALLFRAGFDNHLFPSDVNKALFAGTVMGSVTAIVGLARIIRDHRHQGDEQAFTVGDIVMRRDVAAANQLDDIVANLTIRPPETDQL